MSTLARRLASSVSDVAARAVRKGDEQRDDFATLDVQRTFA